MDKPMTQEEYDREMAEIEAETEKDDQEWKQMLVKYKNHPALKDLIFQYREIDRRFESYAEECPEYRGDPETSTISKPYAEYLYNLLQISKEMGMVELKIRDIVQELEG